MQTIMLFGRQNIQNGGPLAKNAYKTAEDVRSSYYLNYAVPKFIAPRGELRFVSGSCHEHEAFVGFDKTLQALGPDSSPISRLNPQWGRNWREIHQGLGKGRTEGE